MDFKDHISQNMLGISLHKCISFFTITLYQISVKSLWNKMSPLKEKDMGAVHLCLLLIELRKLRRIVWYLK